MSLRSTTTMQRPMAAWASRIPCQVFRTWWRKRWDSSLMARANNSSRKYRRDLRCNKPSGNPARSGAQNGAANPRCRGVIAMVRIRLRQPDQCYAGSEMPVALRHFPIPKTRGGVLPRRSTRLCDWYWNETSTGLRVHIVRNWNVPQFFPTARALKSLFHGSRTHASNRTDCSLTQTRAILCG